MKRKATLIAVTIMAMSAGQILARSLSKEDLAQVRFDQHIGQQISPGLTFVTSTKRSVTLGGLQNGKPTLLVLGYYHCPMLCTLINDALIEALLDLRLNVGRDFNVINVSIDPTETPELAAGKKREYLTRYGRPNAAAGWYFLTGDERAIAQLANEAGFRYKYDPEIHQYAHPSGFILLTPAGKISRYFFGVNFDPEELNRAIVAASKNQSGSVIKELILLCCQYSPITGKYGELILRILQVAGTGTFLLLAGWIIWMNRRTPRQKRTAELASHG